MTRGNQRDNDRAKALKKAGNSVRLIPPRLLFIHTDRSYRRTRTPRPVANSLRARMMPLPSCARSKGRVCIPEGARRKFNRFETGLLIAPILQRTKRKLPRLQQEAKRNNASHLSIPPVSQSHLSPPFSRSPKTDNRPSSVAKRTTSEGRRWVHG